MRGGGGPGSGRVGGERRRDSPLPSAELVTVTDSEYFGLLPLYMGPLSARNFSHLYDCRVPTPPPSLPGNEAVIGADALRSPCG